MYQGVYIKCMGRWVQKKEWENLSDKQKPKIVKPESKQAHFTCEVTLYQEFEKYCYGNGKSVAEALRSYMKICLGK